MLNVTGAGAAADWDVLGRDLGDVGTCTGGLSWAQGVGQRYLLLGDLCCLVCLGSR